MSNVYLSLNFTDGKFFKYSKEEKEGYEKHESSKGNISYREYLNKGVTGSLKGLKLRESEYGNEIQLLMENDEGAHYCTFKIYDQKGQVDNTFVKDLIKVLPNMELGREYTVFPYRFKPDDSKYFKSGVSVKQNGERVEQAISETFIKSDGTVVTEGQIPAVIFKKDVLLNKNMPTATSLEARHEVLSTFLVQELERLGKTNDTQHAAAKAEPVEAAAPTPVDNVEVGKPAVSSGTKLPF